MEAGSQPVRSNPSFRARRGKPLWSLTRLSRSSAQAKTVRPSSRKETVASLSSGLIPSTRMVFVLRGLTPPALQVGGNFGDGGRAEVLPAAEDPQHLVRAGVQPVLGGRVGGVAVAARHQRGAVQGEADAGEPPPPQPVQEGEHVAPLRA